MKSSESTQKLVPPPDNAEVGVLDNIVGFTQNSSFHGIKYIGEDTRYTSRRILWIVVVLTVSGLFISALVDRILTYYSYPSNIELRVGYVKHLDFPTVTVCNQNPYSLVPLQRSGLYDIITRTYKSLDPVVTKTSTGNCKERFVLNPVVCTIPSQITYNMIHHEITIGVCEELCTNYSTDSCSGFLYDSRTQSCTLTSYTGEDKEWYTDDQVQTAKTTCEEMKMYFFRRIRCTDDSDILCNFEDGSTDLIYADKCRFDHGSSDAVTEYWVKVQGADNTYGTPASNGHYLTLFETGQRGGNMAQIVSPYLNTTGKCFMAFATIAGSAKGNLRVILQTESLQETILLKLGHENYTNGPTWTKLMLSMHEGKDHWISLYSPLPAGLHRIIIEGTRATSGQGGIHIDDIEISDCTKFTKECIRSPRGVNYMGKISKSQGKNCMPWTLAVSFFSPGIFKQYDHRKDNETASIFLPDRTLQEASNYCRQPTKGDWTVDFLKPICVTELVLGGLPYVECDISRCTCGSDDFRCEDGECIHQSLVCDGKADCMDRTDETNACRHKDHITCDFEDSYLCGYSDMDGTFTWNRVYDTTLDQLNGNAHSLQMTNYDHSADGEIATLVSPYLAVPFSQHITLQVKMEQRKNMNGFYIRLAGSYGLTRTPVFSVGNILSGTNISLVTINKLPYGWNEVDICVPGYTGKVQRLMIQTVFKKEDNFGIDSINFTGQSCHPNFTGYFTAFPRVNTPDCKFQTDKCEYTEISGHTNLIWEIIPTNRVPTEMSISGTSHIGGLDSSITNVVSLRYDGTYSTKQFISRLISPISTFNTGNCLTFYYIKKSVFNVRLEGIDGIAVFNDSRLSIYPVWAKVMLSIGNTTDNVHLVFYGLKTTYPYLQHSLSIAQVQRSDSSCLDLVKNDKYSTISCDFEDVHQCGYVDMSEKPNKWVRDTLRFEGIVGGVMRYGSDSLMDASHVGRLVSPLVTIRQKGYLKVNLAAAQRICLKIQLETATSKVIKVLTNRCIHYYSLDSKEYRSPRSLRMTVSPGVYSVVFLSWLYQKSHFPSSYIYLDNITIAGSCMPKGFTCKNQECIQPSERCDSIKHCSDNSDETGCTSCQGGAFKCRTSKCVRSFYRCNGYDNCGDGSDEISCTSCSSSSFHCKNKKCIPSSQRCDGTDQCGDKSDEASCVPTYKNYIVNSNMDCNAKSLAKYSFGKSFTECGEMCDRDKGCPAFKYTTMCLTYLECNTPLINKDSSVLYSKFVLGKRRKRSADEINPSSLRIEMKSEMSEVVTKYKQKRSAPSNQPGTNCLDSNSTSCISDAGIFDNNDTIIQPGQIHVTHLYLSNTEWLQLMISPLEMEAGNYTKSIAHNNEDFVLSCVWNNHPCKDYFIKEVETDTGHCISFNKDSELISKRSGLLYGLQLSLNVEGYQNVEGVGQDAGIKIHFHPSNEIPILRTTGYAVSPGSRTLFNLKYGKSTYLEPKYGTCGTKDLFLYDQFNYTTSHCLSQCDAEYIIQQCNCVPSYVTGTNDSCHLNKYLNCVLVNERTDTGSECVCPDACHQEHYDAKLSYSQLSAQALSSVLADSTDEVRANYHKALNLHQRADQGKYLEFVTKIKTVTDSIKKMEHFINTNPGTVIARIQKAFDNIVNITLKDVQNTVIEIQQVHDEYFSVDDEERKYMVMLGDEVQKSIQDMFYTFTWETNPCIINKYTLAESLDYQLTNTIDDINALNHKLSSHNLLYVYYECKNDPSKCPTNTDLSALHGTPFAARSKRMPAITVLNNSVKYSCQTFYQYKWKNVMVKFEEIREGLEYVVSMFSQGSYNSDTSCEKFRKYGASMPSNEFHYDYYDANYKAFAQYYFFEREYAMKSAGDVWGTFLDKLKQSPPGIYDYHLVVTETLDLKEKAISAVNIMKPCLTEYADFLKQAISWRNTFDLNKYLNLSTQTVNVEPLNNIWMHLDLLYRRFTLNNLNKADLVQMLINDPKNITFSHITDTIVTLKKQFEQEINTPLYTSIDALNVDLNSLYDKIIYDMLNYSTYMGETKYVRGAEYVYMLRKMMPNINSGTFQYLLSPSQVRVKMGSDIFQFLKSSSRTYISEAINTYLLQLKNELYQLYNQYVEMENEVINSLEDLETILQSYKAEMMLDSTFMSNNLLQLNVFFGELKETEVVQQVGYSPSDFFGDLGGYLGLLLGASIITLVEVMDFIIFKVYLEKKAKKEAAKAAQQQAAPRAQEREMSMIAFSVEDSCLAAPNGMPRFDHELPIKKQNWVKQ